MNQSLREPQIIGRSCFLHSHEKAATTAALTSIPISDISREPNKLADCERIYVARSKNFSYFVREIGEICRLGSLFPTKP